MSPEKLAYSANQIGKFFNSRPETEAVDAIANHIARFWDPRMRATIYAHERAGGGGLDPRVLKAVTKLRIAAEAKTA